ncbi:GerAB/ArcD/ProY family transporter [Paenibacillus silvisoli]|uniref:GerAB/ArcD/ProY family transporter n=1 Tax=Paenibacillus silvisoli TaxID=3110539 RepID=UPI0028039589|nr:GerAB/ArcD/ProY family transporter [Paenibacillus silvisoli]
MNITITRSQLFFLIIKTQIGIGLLSLPAKIQSSAKGDSWISVLLAGAVVQLVLLVYWLLLKKYPDDSLSGIAVRLLGPYLGRAVNAVYFAFFLAIAAYASTLYVQLVKNWLLPLTPSWLVLLLIVGTCLYLAVDNLRIIARFFVLSSVLFVLLVFISIFTFENEVYLTNLLPIGQTGMMPILEGSEKTFFSMLGFEVSLFYFSQVQGNRKGMLRAISLANVFVTLFYTYFVLICLIGFSPSALQEMNEPVLFILKGIAFQLFDRIDLIFLTIWIIPMTATIVSYMTIAGKSLTKTRRAYRRLVAFSGTVIFVAGWYLSLMEDITFFSKWLEYGYLVMIVGVPFLLWLGSFLVPSNGNAKVRPL